MGRLLGLELSHFKSYKDKVNIGFGDSDFTCIIGPNGSGKSNLMDAICFVLGVRSLYLRSNVLKDLVYRGIAADKSTSDNIDASTNGIDTDHSHTSNSDVVTASNGNNTLSNGSTPNTYVKAFYKYNDEITELMRTVSISGDTHYKINDKPVSYKEYSTFLESQNILIKAKNFLVFQGDVEKIASQSSLDLSALFEQVSGSFQYKKEYDSLKENIEKSGKSTIDFIKNKKRLLLELKTYKEGISKNDQYKKQSEKIGALQLYLNLWNLYQLKQKNLKLTDNLSTSRGNIQTLKEKLTNQDSLLKSAKKNFIKQESLILKQNNKLDSLKKKNDNLISERRINKLSTDSTEKNSNHLKKRLESLNRDLERETQSIKIFKNQLKVVIKSKNNFESEIKEALKDESKYQLSNYDLKLYHSCNENYITNGGGSTIEENLSLLNNKKQEVLDVLKRFNKRLDESKLKISDDLNIKLENLNSSISDLNVSLNGKNTIYSEKIKELKNLQSIIESTNNKDYDLNFKLRELLLKIDELNANQRESVKQQKLREKLTILKRLFPGVKGLLNDLCSPKLEKYSLAISTILGRNFDSIVVDNLNVAQECIAYLKKQRLGTATFIPLDTIEVDLPNSLISSLSDSNDYVLTINVIEYDSKYERALQYVCSNSIICKDLQIAKDLKWNKNIKAKLVTLDGALIHKAGLMTGGISNNGNGNNNKNRWDKDEFRSLIELKDKLLIQIEETSFLERTSSIKARDLENSIAVLNNEIGSLRSQLVQLKRSLQEVETELKYHKDLLENEYNPKISELNGELTEIEKKIQNLELEKEGLQVKFFKEFSNKLGFTIKDYENHSGELMRQQSKELQSLQKQILTVENKLEFEKERLETTQRRYDTTNTSLKNSKDELETLNETESSLNSQVESLQQDLKEHETYLQELQEQCTIKQREFNSVEETLDEYNNEMNLLKHNKNGINEDIEKIDLERLTILENCKISNIPLPITSKIGLDELPITTMSAETLTISKKIEIDFNKLPNKYKDDDNLSTRQRLESQIHETKESLDDLQPNARAVQRFDEAKEKFDVVDKETENLKTEEKKILNRFLQIKKKRKELFEKCFDYVNEHLDIIYRELTKNPHSNMELSGGNASLTIEDEDEPFNAGVKYHATPPLKRFKDMEYLSGGEKSVAALALLFAINSYQPSPFFVLDEVDAALDITNVERVAAYIRRHRNPGLQFIVISLKNTLFEKSDALVGVYREQQQNSSNIVTLDLRNYTE